MADLARISQTALKEASKATSKDGPLSDPKKLAAAGVGLVALPGALEQIAKRVAPKASDLGGQAKLKPGSSEEGDSDDEGRAAPGHGGSGRRMPIQQSVDVAVPIKVAYNRWTMFEDWPDFMHRVESVDQADDTTLFVSMKIWGITRRFEAQIVEQRPDQRIEWNVTEGLSQTGVVTFHKLSDRLTRIEVSLDIEPQGMLEKMGRGMRFAKRAVRADLHRFKALIELDEEAEGGWRGTIEDGEVKRRTEGRSNGSKSRSRSQSKNGSRASSSSGSRRSRSKS